MFVGGAYNSEQLSVCQDRKCCMGEVEKDKRLYRGLKNSKKL